MPEVGPRGFQTWMLSPFSAENGGTWVVPRSHLDLRNPRSHLDPRNPPELHDDVDPSASISGEIQLKGQAGSVLMLDSRIWHSPANNPSTEPRVTILTRYLPWWISLEFGGRNRAMVPKDVFEKFPESVKDLYRHRVEGEEHLIRIS
jgi:ectoine hydroxylase-related dioxygenase (phytanoyl-CoA dioxygenase family)